MGKANLAGVVQRSRLVYLPLRWPVSLRSKCLLQSIFLGVYYVCLVLEIPSWLEIWIKVLGSILPPVAVCVSLSLGVDCQESDLCGEVNIITSYCGEGMLCIWGLTCVTWLQRSFPWKVLYHLLIKFLVFLCLKCTGLKLHNVWNTRTIWLWSCHTFHRVWPQSKYLFTSVLNGKMLFFKYLPNI